MPTNRDVETFLELRQGFQGMADFAAAALAFLDRNGIALGGRSGHGAARTNGKRIPALREQVKRAYTRRQPIITGHATLTQTPEPPRRRLSYSDKRLEARRLSAAILEALDRTEPRQPIPEGRKAIGALVRRGYVRKKKDGYVRTAKVYTVSDQPSSANDEGAAQTNGDGAGPASGAPTVPEAAEILGVSDSYVRLLVKQGKMAARSEMRSRRGMHKLVPTLVLDRDEIARYQASVATAG